MKKVKIGDFLFERKGKYKPSDKAIQELKRIEKINFSGIFHIGDKPLSPIIPINLLSKSTSSKKYLL